MNQYPGLSGQLGQLGQFCVPKSYLGSRPLVVCAGSVHECETIEKAQELAEALAHQYQTTAFVLTPVSKVTPKRESVWVQLP